MRAASRRQQIEVGIFLLLIGPSLVGSLLGTRMGAGLGFVATAVRASGWGAGDGGAGGGGVRGGAVGGRVAGGVIFALGGGCEGGAGVITGGVVGLGFGLVRLWRGSLVAPVVMHFLQDFLAIVVRPLAHRGG